MAISLEEIKKLRTTTGAGLGDCKKALEEAEGNMEAAVEILRKKGQAVAAKRSDRETSNGCVLVKVENGFAAMLALKCETDFVANNADFIALTQSILDLAVANKCADLEAVKALPMGGATVQDAVTDRSGITGEKMELDGYLTLEGEHIAAYNHMNRNTLCALVQLNNEQPEAAKAVAIQVAAMNPVAIDEASVPAEVVANEEKRAVEKTQEEMVKKAVDAALKKAGFNLYIAESEEHLEEGIRKGNITEAQADEIRALKAKTAEEKAASLPAEMIQNIAKGRMNKFFKEFTLVNQEMALIDGNPSVKDYLHSLDKELAVVAFRRFTLSAE